MHIPVLLDEVLGVLAIKPSGLYIDGTFGGGSHSRAILKKLNAKGRLIAFDKDLHAKNIAQETEDQRFSFVHGSFANLKKVLINKNLLNQVDGVFCDLGVSSFQLDKYKRGFSFKACAPLDMRMDQSSGQTLGTWLETATFEKIKEILKNYGQEKYAHKIAQNICEFKKTKPIVDTKTLAQIVEDSYPTREKIFIKKHVATKSFQAFRIFINNELQDLKLLLNDLISILAPFGRFAFISFHSLEDGLIKRFIRENSKIDPKFSKFPIEDKTLAKNVPLSSAPKAIFPSPKEIKENPRSRSAVLRFAQKKGDLY